MREGRGERRGGRERREERVKGERVKGERRKRVKRERELEKIVSDKNDVKTKIVNQHTHTEK